MMDLSKFSYCEGSWATANSPWHIRELTAVGKKLGGGIDTASLCGRVQPFGKGSVFTCGGWDLLASIDLDDAQGANRRRVCQACIALLLQKIGATK